MTDVDEQRRPEPPLAADETATLLGFLEYQRRDREPPRCTVDWKADPDWEWHSAAEDSPEQLHALWQDAVARSRSLVAEALADGGLDRLAQRTWPDGRAPSLRRILIDVIEEYARHVGHADLIPESVDGLTGEDPPG